MYYFEELEFEKFGFDGGIVDIVVGSKSLGVFVNCNSPIRITYKSNHFFSVRGEMGFFKKAVFYNLCHC